MNSSSIRFIERRLAAAAVALIAALAAGCATRVAAPPAGAAPDPVKAAAVLDPDSALADTGGPAPAPERQAFKAGGDAPPDSSVLETP